MQIMKKAGSSQQRWLAATQKRLKRTKQMLDSLKGIKMTSQDSVAYQTLTRLRLREIKESSSFRWIILMTGFLCKSSCLRTSDIIITLITPLSFSICSLDPVFSPHIRRVCQYCQQRVQLQCIQDLHISGHCHVAFFASGPSVPGTPPNRRSLWVFPETS